jgi:hypothetical protein
MRGTAQGLKTLDEFVNLETLLPIVELTFPTKHSLAWFVRLHRSELATAGALIYITGRLRFHPALFQRAVLKIGRSRALAVRGAA